MTRRTALAIGVAALLAGTSVGVIKARSDDGDGPRAVTPGAQTGPIEPGGTGVVVDVDGVRPIRQAPDGGVLISYSSCSEFIAAVRAEASEHVGPWGWQGTGYGGGFRAALADEELATVEAAPAPAAEPSAVLQDVGALAAEAGVDFSVTNVQERGIDEPDIVKTDGETIYVVVQTSLYAIDATGDEPRLLDRLDLDTWGAQLLLTRDRLLVMGHGNFAPHRLLQPEIDPGFEEFDEIAPYGGNGTTLTLVDVSRPDRLEVAETLSVEGAYLTARLTGKSVRLVTSSFPEVLPFVYPEESGFLSELNAGLENQRIVSRLGASDWLPDYVREDHVTGASESGLAVGCSNVRMPVESSGFGMLSVLTLDPANGLSPVDSDAVMTDGQTVYVSAEGLYVSTPHWSNEGQNRRRRGLLPRRTREHAHPSLRHQRALRHGLHGQRRGAWQHAQSVLDVGARGLSPRGVDRPLRPGELRHRARDAACEKLENGRPCRQPRARRADLRCSGSWVTRATS